MLVSDFLEPVGKAPLWKGAEGSRNLTVDPRVEDLRHAAYGVVAPIIVLVGMVGNLLTIMILRLPQFRGVTYTYFLALAVSDFLALGFSISILYHIIMGGTPHYSEAVWFSYYELLFTNIPMSTSVLIVVCVTVDRFFSVCRPTDFKRIHTSRNARAGILISVLTSVVVWLPTCLLMDPKLYDKCETFFFEPPDNRTWWVACISSQTLNSPYYIAYRWLRQIIVTFIPIIILLVLNTLILKEFTRLRKTKHEMSRGQPFAQDGCVPESRSRDDQHLISLLKAVMISFFVTLVPSGICNAIYTEVLATRMTFEVFRAVSNDLEILNHALNFYMYILCSKPIRAAIRTFFQEHKFVTGKRSASNVVTVVRRSIKRDLNNAQQEPTSTKGNVILRKQTVTCRDDPTPREKSSTVSKDSQQSDIFSDSSLDNTSEIGRCSTDGRHLRCKPISGSTDTLHSWGSSVHCEITAEEAEGRGETPRGSLDSGRHVAPAKRGGSPLAPEDVTNTTSPGGNTTSPGGNTTSPGGNTTSPGGNTTSPRGNTNAHVNPTFRLVEAKELT
ncbi:probable G-protein coupled receptor B0563.6 [Procambarus clarkii]|uniref:probable G-protein coupled receptor B0563.6 n=1 Tax=Procambarus clarkii TaxID=6728 RepID=UPI003742D0BE